MFRLTQLTHQKKTPAQNEGIHFTQKLKLLASSQNRIFLALMVFSFVFLLISMVFYFKRTYQTARNEVIELSKNSSKQNAEDIELFFLRHEDVLLTAGEVIDYSLSQKDMDLQDVRELLHNISLAYSKNIYTKYVDKEFTGVYAAINGVMLHGIKTDDDLPTGYDPLKRPWYKEGIAGGGDIVFGEPYQDIYTPYMVMTATKMLSGGKNVIGMDITLEDLQFAGGNMDVSITVNGNAHAYGYGFVLTGQGIVVAHRDETQQGANYNDPTNPMYVVFQQIKQCTERKTDYFETTIDGVTYGIFPQKINSGWYVVTLTDLEDISAVMSEFSILLMVGSAFVILFALVYCYLITRSHIKAEHLAHNLKTALDLAKKDGLTGHSNRTAYDMRVQELAKKLNSKKDESFVTVMMDLNDLKYVNDNYGHAAGDQYIRNSCRLVRSVIPSEIYRFGGDEFALFLTGALFENGKALCEELKEAVNEGNRLLVPNVDKPSIAIGISVHTKGAADDMDSLLRKADTEMYTNKAFIKQERLKKSKQAEV